MDKALISFSFDDARKDNLYVFREILWPLHFPATINVTTGYVDGTCPKEHAPCLRPAMTIDDIKCIRNQFQYKGAPLFEIALHGDQHLNTENDIAAGRKKLITWLELPEDYIFGFASPGSGLQIQTFKEADTVLFKQQISYMRTSLRIIKNEKMRVLCRKISRVWHRPSFYLHAYADTLMTKCPDRIIYSVPVMKDITEQQVETLVDLAIKRRAALTLMFHSVDVIQAEDDNWVWGIEKFKGLVNYLNHLRKTNAPLELCTTQTLFRELTLVE